MENKKDGDDLFDRLNTSVSAIIHIIWGKADLCIWWNSAHVKSILGTEPVPQRSHGRVDRQSIQVHLHCLILIGHSTIIDYSSILKALTPFSRTFNASHTLQQQLDELTDKVQGVFLLERHLKAVIFQRLGWVQRLIVNFQEDNLAAKMLSYNRANRAVAILCNHQVCLKLIFKVFKYHIFSLQRAVPKTHDKAMENLDQKLELKQENIKKAEKELKHLKKVQNLLFSASITPLFHIRQLKVAATRENTRKKRKQFKSAFLIFSICYP